MRRRRSHLSSRASLPQPIMVSNPHTNPVQKAKSYLPQNQPSTFCPQHQDIPILSPRNRKTAYPLRERHRCFLIPFLSAIDVHDRLFRLRRKHMRRAHSQAIPCRRAFLKCRTQCRRRLKFLDANPDIPQRRGRRCFRRRECRRNEAL